MKQDRVKNLSQKHQDANTKHWAGKVSKFAGQKSNTSRECLGKVGHQICASSCCQTSHLFKCELSKMGAANQKTKVTEFGPKKWKRDYSGNYKSEFEDWWETIKSAVQQVFYHEPLMNHWVQNKLWLKFVEIRSEVIPNLGRARTPECEKWVRELRKKGVVTECRW
jgi:hypothetical protein